LPAITAAKITGVLLLVACGETSEQTQDLPRDHGEIIPVFSTDISGSDRVAFCRDLEQRGFDVFPIGRVGKHGSGEFEVGWNCNSKKDSLELQVEVFSREGSSAFHSLHATVTAEGTGSNARDGLAFLVSTASLNYAGSDSAKVKQWLLDNIDNKGAKITIGSVRFWIWVPSERMTALWIDGV
jgi:hypothetical protein